MDFDEIDMRDVEDEREAPEEREHETYTEQDNWSVLDITAVDRIFATGGVDDLDHFNCHDVVRFDLDGISLKCGLSEYGENVNTSVFLDEDAAEQLIAELESALRESRREAVNDAK